MNTLNEPILKVLFMVTRDVKNPAVSGGDMAPWEYARYLAYKGHSITYVTSRFPGSAKKEMVDGVEVIRLGGVLTLWFRTFIFYVLL